MAGRRRAMFAADIISSHFGELVGKVCKCLLNHGTLSLQEIARLSELPTSKAKKPLLVLIQHNCVQAFSITTSDRGYIKYVTQYMAIVDNILHRLRFPKFLMVVRAELGANCESVLEGLLQHGRLTFEQLTARQTAVVQVEGCDMATDFNKLVSTHYVERCPIPEPDMAKLFEDETLSLRKRASKNLPIEQKALMAAALSEGERFCTLSFKSVGHDPEPSIGEKRKREILELDAETQTAIDESEVLWRVNVEKFFYCVRMKACVANVRSSLGLDAGDILEAMISTDGDLKWKSKDIIKSSMDRIIEAMRKRKPSPVTIEHVRTILGQLGCRSCPEEAGLLYAIDLKGIIERCQQDEIEALVMRRYGKSAYRIFRLLVGNGLQETDRISEITFIERKESNEILFKLWRDGYLEMEKAITSSGKRSEYYMWKVNKHELRTHILDDMYHSALNLLQKMSQLHQQEHEAVLREKVKLLQLQAILHSSLMKLDEAILLFGDTI